MKNNGNENLFLFSSRPLFDPKDENQNPILAASDPRTKSNNTTTTQRVPASLSRTESQDSSGQNKSTRSAKVIDFDVTMKISFDILFSTI